MFTSEYYNAKRVAKMECRQCLQVVAEATGYWVGWPSSRQQQTMHVPVLLIPLNLLTNWSYT